MNQTIRPDERSVVRTLHFLWIGFLLALLAYLVVALLINRGRDPNPDSAGLIASLRWVFLVLGAICFVCAFRVRERMLGRLKTAGEEKAKGTLTAFLVGWAFLDAIALFGLVLAFLGGSLPTCLPWIVAAILGVLMQRPDPAWLGRWLGSGTQH